MDLTIQGYFLPVSGLVRFSVRKTGTFSWALPINNTPSRARKRVRYSAATSSLRCSLSKGNNGMSFAWAKASMFLMKVVLIGAINADDTTGCCRW